MVPAPMHRPADVAVGALERVLAGVAVAAEELDGLVAHELGRPVGGRLGHRRLQRGRGAAVAGQVHGPAELQPRPFERDRHVGELPLETLEHGQRLAADHPLVDVADGVLERALGGADAHRRVAAALVVEVGQQLLERSVFDGSPAIRTSSGPISTSSNAISASVEACTPIEWCTPGERHARPVHVDHDRADALRTVSPGPAAPHEDALRHVAEGRVVLVAVEPEAGAVLAQRGAHLLHGRPRVGLGDADRDERLAVGHLRQPPLLHGRRPEVLDAAGRAVERELRPDGARHVGPGQLLQHERRLDVAVAEPAPLLADGHPQQVGGGQRLGRLERRVARLVVLAGAGRELARGDVAGELAQRRLVLGLGERIAADGPGHAAVSPS